MLGPVNAESSLPTGTYLLVEFVFPKVMLRFISLCSSSDAYAPETQTTPKRRLL